MGCPYGMLWRIPSRHPCMPSVPSTQTSVLVLEIEPDQHHRACQVLVLMKRVEGDEPSITLHVRARQELRHDAWEDIGSFGGRLERRVDGEPVYKIDAGNMYLERLRGRRIGTWCQNQVMLWLQQQPPGRTCSITLTEGDARGENRGRRNRLYEQFGSQFVWDIPGVAGRSPEQPTSDFRPIPEVRGVYAMEISTALAKAYSRIEQLELEVAGCRKQLGNGSMEMDRMAVREARWRRICIGVVVVVGLVALWLLRG